MSTAQHKTVSLLKTFFCPSVFVSVSVFNVWPRDAKRLDTLADIVNQERQTETE